MINLSSWQKEFDPFGKYDLDISRDISNLLFNRDFFVTTKIMDVRKHYKSLILSQLPNIYNEITYATSGSEALEHAIVISWKKSGRTKILVFRGCYHGSSINMLPISYPEYGRNDLYIYCDPPYCFRCHNICERTNSLSCLMKVENTIVQHEQELAGILIDPSFGNILLNENTLFFKGIQKLCKKYALCLIFDETRTSFGRKGSLFSFTSLKILPDIIVMNKSLACGVPLGLTIYNDTDISNADKNEIIIRETTFAGNRLSLGVATIVLNHFLMRYDVDNYNKIFNYMKEKLNLLKRYSKVGDVRNFGNIYAIEIVGKNNEYDKIAALFILNKLNKNYNIEINPPNYKSVILIYPMPNISIFEIDHIYNSFCNVLEGFE